MAVLSAANMSLLSFLPSIGEAFKMGLCFGFFISKLFKTPTASSTQNDFLQIAMHSLLFNQMQDLLKHDYSSSVLMFKIYGHYKFKIFDLQHHPPCKH